jgi:hypothetical protein
VVGGIEMNVFINEVDKGMLYEISDVFYDFSTMSLEVDPELAEEWREVIDRYYEVQEEIRGYLAENGEVVD